MDKSTLTKNLKTIKCETNAEWITDLINMLGAAEVFGKHLDGVWFVLSYGDRIAGLINLRAINNVMWVPHIYIRDQYRGNASYEWGNMVVEYMKQNMGAKKFLAITPFRSAKSYAEKMGFTYVTTLQNSVLVNNEMRDQYMLEKNA